VADENGYLKFFLSHPKLKPVKDIAAQKSCIYDLEWLNRNELACGGGDQVVSIYDVNTGVRTSILKGHTESVKSLSQSTNPFVIASGSRDGTILVYDLRCNKNQSTIEQIDNFTNEVNQTVTYIRSINSLQFALNAQATNSTTCSSRGGILKSKTSATLNPPMSSALSGPKRSSPVSCVLFQSENLLASAGATDGLIKVKKKLPRILDF
jgi:WD40 repeat protein